MKPKKCPRCGKIFECGADEPSKKCRCEEISFPPGMSEYLRRRYADCLCPACLEFLAARFDGNGFSEKKTPGP